MRVMRAVATGLNRANRFWGRAKRTQFRRWLENVDYLMAGYRLFISPRLVYVLNKTAMSLYMQDSESFLLLPEIE